MYLHLIESKLNIDIDIDADIDIDIDTATAARNIDAFHLRGTAKATLEALLKSSL